MQPVRSFGVLLLVLAMSGCSETESPIAPQPQTEPAIRGDHHGNRVVLTVHGRADHTRIVGADTALTLFRFHMEKKANGETRGRYYYNFQAAGFAVQGPVTCVTVNGNQAWVGGTVESVESADPDRQSLVGLEMWWRSIDLGGHGRHAVPDSTTGLGFGFAGTTITAESWCNDQPVALVIRQVEHGNVKIREKD